MTVSETQLDIWCKQGSIAQSAATYQTIRSALEDSTAPYAGKQYSIFLQGSYCNDTNIYADSDVDVVVRLDSTFYHDLAALTEDQKTTFHKDYSNVSYGLTEFKRDVVAQLTKKYGAAVKPGSKAIFVKGEGARRDADVIVAAQYRRYFSYSSSFSESFVSGICFFDSKGERIANFPKQHSDNCTTKHQATNSWFKPSVRILKNLRNRMIDDGLIEEGLAPSYFLEGMAYNMPNGSFGASYVSTISNCLNFIKNHNDRPSLLCANEQYYLLRDGVSVTWNDESCMKYVRAAIKFWNEW